MSPTLGLYFDFRNPEPWRRDPAAYYGWHLDLMEEADRLLAIETEAAG